MSLNLTFHGAAECVTGFCARLETGRASILVDCGMFQGSKTLKALNYQDFPFDPRGIDIVLLTHAHLDHSGLLPKLVKAGFRGAIFATAGARDLARIMLADSGEIQESEVEHLNRRNQRRGRAPVTPIYTARDVAPTLALFQTIKMGEPTEVAPGVTATYWNAGHILGAASVEVVVETGEGPVSLLFSGDIGPGGREYVADPEGPSGVDHLILESTYGARERPPIDPASRRRKLARELRDAHAAGGPVLIPAFAVERSQELLVDLITLMNQGDLPMGEIFLDSPLAIEATEVFLRRGWNRDEGANPFAAISEANHVRFLEKPWESDTLDRLRGWHIILAGSGMCDAGRVRKHLKRLLWRREATVLLTGFQANGTLGRLLADGRERVRIQGDDIRVLARIRSLDIYSGHADASGLVEWAKHRAPIRGRTFLVHGEPEALNGLSERLAAAGFDPSRTLVPTLDAGFSLAATAVEPAPSKTAPRLPSGTAASLDWHNARSELLGALEGRLDSASGDAERIEILDALRKALSRAGPA